MNYFPFDNFWTVGKTYKFVVHRHEANRAGLHWDFRMEVDSPKNYISSFASRNFMKLLLGRQKRVLLIPQDLHDLKWLDVKEIEIKRGYGSGYMRMEVKGRATVLSCKENSVKFQLEIKECHSQLKGCGKLKESPISIAFVRFGRNILAVRG